MLKNIFNLKVKNRYIVLVGVLLAQFTIAGLYAWSALGLGLQLERGWSSDAVILPYSIAQTVFALTTILSGKLLDSKGPRIVMLIGALFYGGGLVVSGFANQPMLMNISFGVLTGIGIGFIYICPLATLVKWFPEKKGFVTGISLAVFASGSIVYKQVITFLFDNMNLNVSNSFIILGLISFVLIFIGALFTNNPPKYIRSETVITDSDFTTRAMIKNKKFKYLWVMYLMATIPGLLILGASANIGIEVGGLERSVALGLITILALTNGISRIIAGYLCDKFGTLEIIKLNFYITIISTLLLMTNFNQVMFMIGIVGVVFGFGSYLALFPVFTNRAFGSHWYGANYSIVYQAYGLASLFGIMAKIFVGSFSNLFIVVLITSLIGLVLSYRIGAFVNKKTVVAETQKTKF